MSRQSLYDAIMGNIPRSMGGEPGSVTSMLVSAIASGVVEWTNEHRDQHQQPRWIDHSMWYCPPCGAYISARAEACKSKNGGCGASRPDERLRPLPKVCGQEVNAMEHPTDPQQKPGHGRGDPVHTEGRGLIGYATRYVQVASTFEPIIPAESGHVGVASEDGTNIDDVVPMDPHSRAVRAWKFAEAVESWLAHSLRRVQQDTENLAKARAKATEALRGLTGEERQRALDDAGVPAERRPKL